MRRPQRVEGVLRRYSGRSRNVARRRRSESGRRLRGGSSFNVNLSVLVNGRVESWSS
jgi:hypothetical protein